MRLDNGLYFKIVALQYL